MLEFYDAFESDCYAAGFTIDAREMMVLVSEATDPRAVMLNAISRLREEGLRVGALTNNWAQTPESAQNDGTRALREHFDVFIESSVDSIAMSTLRLLVPCSSTKRPRPVSDSWVQPRPAQAPSPGCDVSCRAITT